MNFEDEHFTERMLEEYNARFRSLAYCPVFYPPSGVGKVDFPFPDGYFESAKVVLEGVVGGQLPKGIHGVAAVFLSRHYLELALKYTLYHSRWLRNENTNAANDEIAPVKKDHHKLKPLWDQLLVELKRKQISTGLDLGFVAEFVKEFHEVDERGMRFRYPGEQLPVASMSRERLGIDFSALLFNVKRAHDILDTLDSYLIERYGQNQDWENEVRSW